MAKLFPLIFMIVGAMVLSFGLKSLTSAYASSNWPTVTGRITASDVERKQSTNGNGISYHAEVLYDYTVNGIAYSNNRIAYGEFGTDSPSRARRIVNRYARGTEVPVYYSAEGPETSVLEPGVTPKTFILAAFGAVFLVIGIVVQRVLIKKTAEDSEV